MTKFLFFVLTFLLTVPVSAQKKEKDFPRAVFVKNDGSEMNVLFVAYTYPTQPYLRFLKGTDILNFEYKLTPEGKTEKIKSDELQLVRFIDQYEDEILGLEKLTMKAVNENGKISEKSMVSWQPLLYDGKIKIYGSNSFMCASDGNQCTYSLSKFYMKNAKDDYAVMPIDYDRLNLLNIWKADERFIEAFKLVGKNCENFNNYVDTVYGQFQDKAFRKKMTAEIKEARKRGFEEAKAEKLRFNASQERVGLRVQEFYLNLYMGIIKEYEKNCP